MKSKEIVLPSPLFTEKEIEQNFQLFRCLLGKKPTWEIPIKIPKNDQYILHSHVYQLLKLLTSSDIQKRQKVHDLFNSNQEIELLEIANWIKKNRISSKRVSEKSSKKGEEEKFLGRKWTPNNILSDKKWQKELNLSAVQKVWWGPKTHSWTENRKLFVKEHFRRLLRLLYSRDPKIYEKVKELFQQKKINHEQIHEFYTWQPKYPALKVGNQSAKKIKKVLRIDQLFTFKVNLNSKTYSLFDGKEQKDFTNSYQFLNI